MATKKVGKAAARAAHHGTVSAARKRTLPKKGDAVWIDVGAGTLGIFVGYSARDKVVTLRWSAGCLLPYLWPETSKSIFNVERENINVLSPEEVFAKVDWLMRRRDEEMRHHVTKSTVASIGGRLFSNS